MATTAQQDELQLMSQLYQEVVRVFVGNSPQSSLDDLEPQIKEIMAKTIAFADANNLTLSPAIIEPNKDAILAMPSPLGEPNLVEYLGDEEEDNSPDPNMDVTNKLKSEFKELTNNTQLVTKYTLFAVVLIGIAILAGTKLVAKIVGALLLLIGGTMLVKHYQSKIKFDKIFSGKKDDEATQAATSTTTSMPVIVPTGNKDTDQVKAQDLLDKMMAMYNKRNATTPYVEFTTDEQQLVDYYNNGIAKLGFTYNESTGYKVMPINA